MTIQKTLLATVAFSLILAGCLGKTGKVHETNIIQKVSSDSLSVLPGSDQSGNAATDVSAGFRLKGRWQRKDGSYYLQIFSMSADSTLKAGYYNPNPINVESGEWTQREGKLFIRVILRDVNYPGSTYVLEYKPDKDILAGNYFQAVDGITYDVIFTRLN